MNIDIPRLIRMLRLKGVKDEQHSEIWACCPNPKHLESEPSWSIRNNPEGEYHGYHYCFGCEWGGNAIELVSAVTGMTHRGALDWVESHGLILGRGRVLPDVKLVVKSPWKKQPAKMPPAVKFTPLNTWPDLVTAYMRKRKITAQMVSEFRLGYALHGRCAGRIVLPAYDKSGVITAYTARTFLDENPRYLNATKDEGYPEHKAIFGEHLWSNYEVAITSEGAINTLAAWSVIPAGIEVGGLYGSHLKPSQLLKLSRFQRIIVLEDPDSTGREFAAELIGAMQGNRKRIDILQMPPGKDPNDLEPQELGRLIRSVL